MTRLGPDNQNIDIEALKRELRQEMTARIKNEVSTALDENLLDQDSEDETEEDPNQPPPPPPESPAPEIVVKFKNANNVFTLPTDINAFGDVIVAKDGTLTVNVVGRIFDDTAGIESYKLRIKSID